MSLNVTRKELYDLVWAKPRAELAKQFAISDVRLGKLCREMNVPAPPRGYWANLAGTRRKRKYANPALPYTVAERIAEDHATVWAALPEIDPKNLDEPIPPPPVISLNLENALEHYGQLVDGVPVPKASREPHPIAQKFITEDDRLARLSNQYSWEKPKFASPQGQTLLKGLNQLLWLFADLGFEPRARGSRNIVMWVGYGQYGRPFEVIRVSGDEDNRGRSKGRRGGYEVWFDAQAWERRSKKPALVFGSFNRAVLRSVALLIIEHWERGFREAVTRTYDWKLADRKKAIEQDRLARERERQRKTAEFQALLDSRSKLLLDGIGGVVRSDEIRSLIQAFDTRIGSQADEVPSFARWRRWAISEADALDPRVRSFEELNEWFDRFQLAD